MTLPVPERETKKVKILVEKDPVQATFDLWAKPGHFSRALSKGPSTTTFVWNLHADAHDFVYVVTALIILAGTNDNS